MQLVDLKLTPEEAKKLDCCVPMTDETAPQYPWGLCISLDDVTLRKLGITDLPDVGTTMQLTAIVEVSNTGQYANQSGKEKSLSLQFTAMALDSEANKPDPASVLYGS